MNNFIRFLKGYAVNDKKLTILPDAFREYDQRDLIKSTIPFLGWLFNAKPTLNPKGVCSALFQIWYEYLIQDEDLITALKNTPVSSQLIKKIERSQAAAVNSYTVSSAVSEEDLPELIEKLKGLNIEYTITKENNPPLQNFEKCSSQVEISASRMLSLEFNEAREKPQVSLQELEAHLNTLKSTNHDTSGLHEIIFTDRKDYSSHSVGWTYHNQAYVFFDANAGEVIYKDFTTFKHFLCHEYLALYGHSQPESLIFNINDYYSNKPSLGLPNPHFS